MIIDSRHEWPFPAIDEASKQPGAWVQISDEHMWDPLECVPPINIPGGFMVGEESGLAEDWVTPTYTAVITANGYHYARTLPITDRNRARALLVEEGFAS